MRTSQQNHLLTRIDEIFKNSIYPWIPEELLRHHLAHTAHIINEKYMCEDKALAASISAFSQIAPDDSYKFRNGIDMSHLHSANYVQKSIQHLIKTESTNNCTHMVLGTLYSYILVSLKALGVDCSHDSPQPLGKLLNNIQVV